MTIFSLSIELGDDAMQSSSDVGAALRRLSEKLLEESGDTSGIIRDENGNTVGRWELV